MSRNLLQSIESWFAQPAVVALGWSLVHFLWQGTAAVLVLAILLFALRKAAPNVRYVIACAGLLLMAACPLGTLMLSWSHTEHLPIADREVVVKSLANQNKVTAQLRMTSEPIPSEPSPVAQSAESIPAAPITSVSVPAPIRLRLGAIRPLLPWFVAVWLIGVAVLSTRLCAGWLWIQRLRRRRVRLVTSEWEAKLRRIADQVCTSRPVRLLESALVEVPVVIGWLRPVILLPASSLIGLSPRQLEAILAHELAHVRRHDYLVNLFQTAIETLLFYHPAVWWVSHTIRAEREVCCDEIAAQVCGGRLEYAQALTSLEELRGCNPQLVVAASDGPLLHRIRRLVGIPAPQTNRSAWWVIAAVTAGLLAMIALNGSRDVPAHASENSSSTAKDAAIPKPTTPMGGGTDAIVTGAPDQSAPEDGIVTGILIKASDKTPVAGAHVILRSDRKYDAESDVEGRFQFKKLPRNPYGYEIWAYQANLITQKTPVTQLQAANTDVAEFAPLHLDMVDGRQAKFIVTSQMTGQPISGAVVRFGYPDRRNVETGHDGTAVIMGLLGQQYDVTIEAEGHARAAPQIDLSHAESVSEYKISLVLGGMVQGVVRDASGQPVPDADVEYRESTGSGYYGDAYRTDGQGHFRNRFLPLNQPIEVSVRKDNYIYEKKNIVLTTSQREIDLPITLARRPKGGSVAGTVTNQSGQPVAGAKVANFGNSANPNITTTTDAQGQFTLDDLVAGLSGFEIVVSAKGFAPQLVSVQPGTTEHPGSLSVKLEQGHAIQGRIVDEQGKPLPQAFVEVRSSGYPPGGLGRAIRTDAAGRFAFDSLPADARFDVMLPAYPLLFNIPLKLDSDDPITVTLESPGAIHGIVMDAESGQPLPQFRVRLGFCRARQPNDPQGTYSSELEQGVTFKSDAGRFAVGPLTNGMPVELTVEAEGYESSVVPRAVAVKADKAEELKISLKRIDITSLFTLSGQLLDYEGKPASAAQLRLIVSRDQPLGINDNNFNWELIKNGQLAGKAYCEQFLSLTTDAQGRFKFQNILPAKYLQLAYWGEGVPRGRSLAFDKTRPAQTDTVTIALPQPAIVRGAIDRSNFPAVGSIQLSRKQEAFDTYEFKVNDDQSTFEFHDLPPGDYSLIVCGIPVRFSKNGQTFFSQSPLAGMQFQLAAGETKEVSFSEPDKPK